MSRELKEKIDAIIKQDIVDIKDVIDDARLDCFDKAKKEVGALGYADSLDDSIDLLCKNVFDHESALIDLIVKISRDQVMEVIEEEERHTVDDGK